MKDSIQDEILKARKARGVAFVNFYNDGWVNTDTYDQSERINIRCTEETVKLFKRMICDAALYSDFNFVESFIRIGLIFSADDVDEGKHINPNAKPMNGIVRVYDGPINGYKDGKLVYEFKDGWYPRGFQHFARYEDLIKELEKGGFVFEGPRTFDDFVCAMATGCNVEIKVSADLKRRKEETQTQVVEEPQIVEETVEELPQQEQTITRKRCLFKRRNK